MRIGMTVPQMKANTGHHSESVLQGYIDQSERKRLIAASAVACESDMPTIQPPSVHLLRHDGNVGIVGAKRSSSVAVDTDESVADVVAIRGGGSSSSSYRSPAQAAVLLTALLKLYNDACCDNELR